MENRYLTDFIKQDALARSKMAFISGPRQCGKTTLARSILKDFKLEENYFSWDDDEFRKLWVSNPKSLIEKITLPQKGESLVVLDELHKHKRWKNQLKGLYDLYHSKTNFIVTGSARLDIYRRSGDSLQGRYFPYRLHPFSLAEKDYIKKPPQKNWPDDFPKPSFDFESLLKLGGFPEPLLRGSDNEAKRWRRLQRERMIREDLRDLKLIRDLQTIETLALLLQERAGSSLSYNALREDLNLSFATVKDWVELLSMVYYCFIVRPYNKRVVRSLKKEPKLFLWDWSAAPNDGARLENMVASHLLKSCHAWTDCAMGEFDLFYVKDKEKREVDFLVTQDKKPYLLVEAKSSFKEPTEALIYYSQLLKPKFTFQLCHEKNLYKRVIRDKAEIFVCSYENFLSCLV